MNLLEKQILENVFDYLDALFDNQCKVVDVYNILTESELVLKELNSKIELNKYIIELNSILKEENLDNDLRGAALYATDDLRLELSDYLPFDVPEIIGLGPGPGNLTIIPGNGTKIRTSSGVINSNSILDKIKQIINNILK